MLNRKGLYTIDRNAAYRKNVRAVFFYGALGGKQVKFRDIHDYNLVVT